MSKRNLMLLLAIFTSFLAGMSTGYFTGDFKGALEGTIVAQFFILPLVWLSWEEKEK